MLVVKAQNSKKTTGGRQQDDHRHGGIKAINSIDPGMAIVSTTYLYL
jgi:hypothetical protein